METTVAIKARASRGPLRHSAFEGDSYRVMCREPVAHDLRDTERFPSRLSKDVQLLDQAPGLQRYSNTVWADPRDNSGLIVLLRHNQLCVLPMRHGRIITPPSRRPKGA